MEATQTTDTASVGAKITRGVVAIYKDHVGRGPTNAFTTISHDHVVVVLEQGLTKAEVKLVASGREEVVRNIRREFQSAMAAELKTLVEAETGRRVRCLLSDHSPDPDCAVEVLLLEP